MMGADDCVKDDMMDDNDDNEEMIPMFLFDSVDGDDTSIISVSCFSTSKISSTLFSEWHRSHLFSAMSSKMRDYINP